jgi:hypothetical protein
VTSEFAYDRGVRLSGTILWFDAARHDVLSFVSSARVEGAHRATRPLCTAQTRALLRVLKPGLTALVAPYGRRMSIGPLHVTLVPAGFMPGSAQALVESDGEPALFASQVCLEPHGMAEPARIQTAATAVLHAAYGRPDFVFPSRSEAFDRIVDAARRTLGAAETPVFLCSAVGKAQEVIRALTNAGIPVCAHRSIAAFGKAYRALGFDPGRAYVFRGGQRHGSALVFPDRLRTSPAIRRMKRARLIWLSGRAAVPDVLARMRVDSGICLSGHLDWTGLHRFADAVGCRTAYVVGAWADVFAQSLRERGVAAHALHKEEQLSLF